MSLPTQATSIFDTGALTELKRAAGERTPEALKAVAQQFEALFLQLVLKQMRESVSPGGGFDGEQAGFYRGLADQQLALNLSRHGGIGLAAALERQLGAGMSGAPAATDPHITLPVLPQQAAKPAAAAAKSTAGLAGGSDPAEGFVARVWRHAEGAAEALGVPTRFVVGHAALETGWGRGELRHADGRSAHNPFNVKATADWRGDVVESSTIEYVDGRAERRVERFRAYPSYAEAFRDYARLLGSTGRYAEVPGQASAEGFAGALARAGYATDPRYAAKLSRVIDGATLRGIVAG